jgi:hypothetical protein
LQIVTSKVEGLEVGQTADFFRQLSQPHSPQV